MCGSVPITVRNLHWPPLSVRHTTRWTRLGRVGNNRTVIRLVARTQAAGHCPCRPHSDTASPGRHQARLSLRSFRTCNRTLMHQPPSEMGMWLHGVSDCTRANRVQLATQAAGHCPCQTHSDTSLPGMHLSGSPKLAFLPYLQPHLRLAWWLTDGQVVARAGGTQA